MRFGHWLSAWVPPLIVAALIWSFGGDTFSASSTSRILGPLIGFLFPGLSAEEHALALYYTRKAAHVVEYGLFALLLLRAIHSSSPIERRRALWFSLVGVALLAMADEFRQGFSAVRTGSSRDVLLDIGGGLAALATLWLFERALGRRLFAEPPATLEAESR